MILYVRIYFSFDFITDSIKSGLLQIGLVGSEIDRRIN